MEQRHWTTACLGALLFSACADDGATSSTGAARGPEGRMPFDAGIDRGPPDTGRAGASPPTVFRLRIENVSGAALPTPFAPGVWVTHADPDPLFTAGAGDLGEGLEALAEDGDPSALAASLDPTRSGVFDTPEGASEPGPLPPGGAYEATVRARPSHGNLSFATMVVQSNDVFVAPAGTGIPLFAPDGTPLAARDVTELALTWNAGTELDQAPGLGPMQAPRQPGPDRGPPEGVVRPFVDGTRTMPLARDLLDVTVTEAGGTFTLTFTNVSADRGLLVTPMAPLFYAVHDDTFALFDTGSPDAGDGLEPLAEDGSPAALVVSHAGAPGVLDAGAVTTPVGALGMGAAAPGERYELVVTPDARHPFLTVASMVVQSNDAFVAFAPAGVRLLDGSGAPRDAAELEAAIRASLAVWDAGTERNEVPGVGPSQAPRQSAPDTGPADPNDAVRRYDDATNDLAGPGAGGFAEVTVEHVSDTTFAVKAINRSDETVYPGALTPVVHALHDDTASLFELLAPASAGLESLAEDGMPATLVAELGAASGVGSVAVADTPVGASGPGPLLPGQRYELAVTADATNRFLSIASMVVPSNDTFVAFAPEGIALLDADGAPRADGEIAADIAASLAAWDAGSEANQAGAGGRDQAPRQAAAGAGEAEGDRTVRATADPIWSYPDAREMLRITIAPLP